MYLYYITYVVPLTILFPLIIGGFRYGSFDTKLRTIFYYLVLSAIISFTSIALAESGQNNLPLLHLFTLLEGVLILLFYQKCLDSYLHRIFFLIAGTGFVCFCFIDSLFIQNIFKFNTYSRFAEAFMIVCLALYFFYVTLGIETKEQWYRNSLILVNIGLLLYFSSSLLLFLFSQVLLSNRQINIAAWVIHATLVMIMYILFAIGFLQYRKPAYKVKPD